MAQLHHRACAEINLDNIKNNINVIRNHINKNVKLMAVIKANAYGHGVNEVANAIIDSVDYFAVASIDEAKQLRKTAKDIPILALSFATANEISDIVEYDIIPTVFDISFPREINNYLLGKNKVKKVHIKINTGMTRLGFSYLGDGSNTDMETINSIREIASYENIEIEGIYSHLSSADEETEIEYTNTQFRRFVSLINKLDELKINIPIKHIANSAATIAHADMHLDMVRPGLIIYGQYPSGYIEDMLPNLKSAMTLKSRITQIREIGSDVSISYGRTYKSKGKMRLATVSIGYGDGYSRLLSNKFHVLINGYEAKICGRVCMDQIVVDITNIKDVEISDDVILIGASKDKEIPCSLMADTIGTINYEVLCNVGSRVTRAYIKDNKITRIKTLLDQ